MRALHQAREAIEEEFEFCGRDENRMRKLHGKAMDQIKILQNSICKRCRDQRKTETSQDEHRDQEEVNVKDKKDEPLIRKRRRRVTLRMRIHNLHPKGTNHPGGTNHSSLNLMAAWNTIACQ